MATARAWAASCGAPSRIRPATSAHADVASRGGRPRLGWLTIGSLAPGRRPRHGSGTDAAVGEARMRSVTDPPRTPEPETPPQVAGERRLPHPPSERYGASPAAATRPAENAPGATPDPSAGQAPARGIAFGGIAALVGAALIVAFGGALAVSAGLLVVASGVGYAVGLATVIGAGVTLPAGARPWIAGVLAALGVVLGQVGLWLFARAEGGVLA